MNWIKTDIDFGIGIKGFEVAYQEDEQLRLGMNKFDIVSLELFFTILKTKNLVPKTAQLIRVCMPPDRMVVIFVATDNSFKKQKIGETYPIENIKL